MGEGKTSVKRNFSEGLEFLRELALRNAAKKALIAYENNPCFPSCCGNDAAHGLPSPATRASNGAGRG